MSRVVTGSTHSSPLGIGAVPDICPIPPSSEPRTSCPIQIPQKPGSTWWQELGRLRDMVRSEVGAAAGGLSQDTHLSEEDFKQQRDHRLPGEP